jgi:hypothetical protein
MLRDHILRTQRAGSLAKGAIAAAAAAALFFIGLVTPGQAAGPFPIHKVAEVRFVTTDLCNMGMLGSTILPLPDDVASHATPKFIDVTDVGRCVSTRPLNPPAPSAPPNADILIGSELFDYATVSTNTGYGTKLAANVTRTQAVPFSMVVESVTGAATSGEIIVGSEVFVYSMKSGDGAGGVQDTFMVTARAQRGSQAADHNASGPSAERVYATPASGKTSSVQTTLSAGISAGQTGNVGVGSTTGAASPGVLLVDNERINYTVVNSTTINITARGATKTSGAVHNAGALVLLPRATPFELEVGDARVEAPFDADAPANPATGTSHFVCLGTETLEYNPSAAQTVGDGLSGAPDVVYVIARGQDRIVGEECGLITPIAQEAQHHVGTALRDATRVQLLGRALPEYDTGSPTTPAQHNPGAAISAPPSHNRCISRTDTTPVAGPDDVTTRTRCYSRLINQPSPPPEPYFVSTNPLTDPFTFHQESVGEFFDETTGLLQSRLNVFVLGQCIAFGSLHVEVETKINVDKIAGDTDYGSFNIRVWLNDQTCTTTPNFVIGATDALAGQPVGTNLQATPLADDVDSDLDGCSDYRELGPDHNAGGDRDPFNPNDYYDVNHDGAIAIGADILVVAGAFGGVAGPAYVDHKDRGAQLGPFAWNRNNPDGSIAIGNDILGVASQFGHACPHAHPSGATPFGPHPTTLSAKVTAAQTAPFAMSVASTAGFDKSGMLLVNMETLTYNQNAGTCGGGFSPATQFCITARGTAAQQSVASVVYQKP